MRTSPKALGNIQDVWLIRPGDYVAIIYKDHMTDELRAQVCDESKRAWPDVRCVLFEGDWDMKVMRPEDTDLDEDDPGKIGTME